MNVAEPEMSLRAAVAMELRRAAAAPATPRPGLDDVDEQALIWLALVPVWTVPLAQACSFPCGTGGVLALLERLSAAGLCLRSRDRVDGQAETPEAATIVAQRQYWMSVTGRKETLQRVLSDPQRGVPYVQATISTIGRAIETAQARGVPVSTPVGRWAALAARPDTRAMADRLTREVEGHLADGETGEALRWLESARALEDLVPAELRPAIDRASRALELFHRREDDERLLGSFMERPEQVDAFDNLVDGPESLWALHYVGAGGLGKTMLMRYITARLAPKRDAATARIDFDFLNPDFPARAPGRLLVQFAEELRRHDRSGEAAHEFAAFDEKIRRLHDRLGTAPPGATTGLEATRSAEFGELLATFAAAARALPQPVLLLLDTCEELAGIRPDGRMPASVEATFTILEQLHELLPTMRVVFCGRRPLASAGAGWRLESSSVHARRPRRPYLRAFQIQGFTRAEAERFLLEHMRVPPELVDAIIKRSGESGDTYRFEWDESHEAAQHASAEPRYSPFRLAQFAAWVGEDPELTAERILVLEADHYVNMRIVGRIRHPGLRALLPTVALLGRFDRATLRAAGDVRSFDDVFEELADQEWIDVQPSEFLEVRPDLRDHLLEFYQRSAPSDLEIARRRTLEHLQHRTLERDWAELDVTHFESVFRLLERRPEQASQWWDAVEARIASARAFDWAVILTERLLADDGPAARREPPVAGPRAKILATHAAALLHTRPLADRHSIWSEVAELAELEPQTPGAQRLRLRALAGQAATAAGDHQANVQLLHRLVHEILEPNTPVLDEQLAAGLVAAVEATLEVAERRRGTQLQIGATFEFCRRIIAAPISSELRAFACALAGRLMVLEGRPADALDWFRRAMTILEPTDDSTPPPGAAWLDWRAPDDLKSRLRLEFARAAYPAILPPERVLVEIGADLPKPITLDAARLAAAILTLRGAIAPPSGEELDRLAEQWVPNRPIDAPCNAHRAVVPLFAAIAIGLAELGRVDDALDWLKLRAREAEEAHDGFGTVQAADRASLHIIRRMRLRDERRGVNTSLAHSTQLEDQALLWEIEGLDDPRSSARVSLTGLRRIPIDWWEQFNWYHAQWRRVYALKPELGGAAIAWAADTLGYERLDTNGSSPQVACFLDALEANLVSERLHLPAPFPLLPTIALGAARGGVDALQWARDPARDRVDALTLILRSAALATHPADITSIVKELSARLGRRRSANIALHEGELLALRLPEQALVLLELAHQWFMECGDAVGALLAQSCAALVLARLGDSETLGGALARLEDDYRATQTSCLSAGRVTLPGWTTLEAAAGSGADALHDVPAGGWRPWLIRITACLAWRRHAGRSRKASVPLVAWLEANYAATVSNQLVLPVELDDWLVRALLPDQPLPRRSGLLRLVRFRLLRLILKWIDHASPGLAIIGGLAWLAVVAIAHAKDTDARLLVAAGATLAGAAVILAHWSGAMLGWATAPLRAVYRRLRSAAIARAQVALTITSARDDPRGSGLPRTVHVELAMQRRKTPAWYLHWIPDTWSLSRPAPVKCLVAGLAPHSQSAASLPEPLRRDLRRVQGQLNGRPTLVELRVDQRLSWIAWEGILGCAVQQAPTPGESPFLFSRTIAPGLPTRSARRGTASRVVSWTADLSQEVAARQGWATLLGDAHFTYQATRTGQLPAAEPPPDVLHLVGTPFETASGVRLPLSYVAPGAEASAAALRSERVRVEDVAGLFPELTLCVLQGTPTDTEMRTDTDREDSGYMRLFAADLVASGVPMVLVIPPLPPSLAILVLGRIAAGVAGLERHGPGGLLAAIAAARDDVAAHSPLESEARLEAAMDVCLFSTGIDLARAEIPVQSRPRHARRN